MAIVLRSGIYLIFLNLCVFAQRRPVTPDDLWQWHEIVSPRISPDGQTAVYSEISPNSAGAIHFSGLRIVDTKGRQLRTLTQGEWRDGSPRWSPDGTRIAFLSDRSGKTQLYATKAAPAAEITQLTHDATEPLAFAWSPDGKQLAFVARVAEPRALSQIFLIPASGGLAERMVTSELDFSGEPAWMPDGRSLVCAAQGQLFNLRLADRAIRALTNNQLVNSDPLPSPDGSKVAFIAADSKPQNYVVRHLWVINADGTRDRMLSGALDRDVMQPQWSNDSRTVYFLADDQGATHLYAGRNDGTTRQITTRPERLTFFSLADNGRAVTVRSTSNEGGNLITFTTDLPGGVVTLAEPNDRLMADRTLGDAQEIHYESDGHNDQAWIVKPPNFDAAKKYPLLLDIRDDPRAMYGFEFRLRAQVFASAGYVVLCANPRGTPGYGEEFGHLLRTRFPGDDADDLLRGVDFVIKQGFVDAKRIFMTGGLVAAWLLGHTDRFTRAVVRNPILDWTAHPALAAQWLGSDPDLLIQRSPITYAASFKTPTLVIGGDPLYAALQKQKVESKQMNLSSEVVELQAILAWLK